MEERESGGAAVSTCPNCDTPARGRWCHACGQDNRRPRLRTRTLIGDAFSTFTDLDSRFMRTLRGLTTRPGAFISEYVAGHRADRFPPFRYLVVLFAVMLVVNPSIPTTMGTASGEAPHHAALAVVGRFLIVFTIAGVFLCAAALWVLQFSRARSYAECAAFTLYAVGHSTALNIALLVIYPLGYLWYFIAGNVVMVLYWGWAIHGYFRVGVFGAVWRVAAMYVFYFLGTLGGVAAFVLMWTLAAEFMKRI